MQDIVAVRYQPDTRRDEPVIMALTVAAERYPRYEFKKLFQALLRQGNAQIPLALRSSRGHMLELSDCYRQVIAKETGRLNFWSGGDTTLFIARGVCLVAQRQQRRFTDGIFLVTENSICCSDAVFRKDIQTCADILEASARASNHTSASHSGSEGEFSG